MENNEDSQSPTPTQNQNNNQADQTNNSGNYSQYIDPEYQKKQKKKKILLILISVIVAFAVIATVVIVVASMSSSPSDSTNESVNVTQICEDEECFTERFSLCQPTKYQESEGNSTVAYEIPGIQEVGCIVSLKYVSNDDEEIVGKEMTCDFDNELDFREALALVDEYPEDFECKGSLIDFYNGLEKEALMLYGI